MHFIYYINKLTATKVDSTYLSCLTSNTQRIFPVAGLERMTAGSAVSALSYRATQVDVFNLGYHSIFSLLLLLVFFLNIDVIIQLCNED